MNETSGAIFFSYAVRVSPEKHRDDCTGRAYVLSLEQLRSMEADMRSLILYGYFSQSFRRLELALNKIIVSAWDMDGRAGETLMSRLSFEEKIDLLWNFLTDRFSVEGREVYRGLIKALRQFGELGDVVSESDFTGCVGQENGITFLPWTDNGDDDFLTWTIEEVLQKSANITQARIHLSDLYEEIVSAQRLKKSA